MKTNQTNLGSAIYILGISALYHNSAACLIKNGEIIAAAEEERFSRRKHDKSFPALAINYCLEEGCIQQHDLAAIVYYDNPYLTFERFIHSQIAVGEQGENIWLNAMPSWGSFKLHIPQLIRRKLVYDGLILHDLHHRSHASSAFYPSPYERAVILTIDGVGEWSTATISIGKGNKIEMLKEMRFPHSLGLLYSAFTQFTGFKVNSGEYKLMGLAPYGEPKYLDVIKEHIADLKEDGSAELHMDKFAFLTEQGMCNEKFAELFGGPPRKPEERITRREMDIARSIQIFTEEAVIRMARYAQKITGETNLCMAGGVALNCVANGKLLREGLFRNIWVQPAAGDAGGALGCALDAYYTYFNKERILPEDNRSFQKGSYLGPAFSREEISGFLETYGYPYRELSKDERAKTLAKYLADGKVIGHFSGRMEFGPRALGARSIIGDARNRDMQVNLNLKIKYRESFRPFAPTVLEENVTDYFDLDRESPYMLLIAPVKKERQLPFVLKDTDNLLEIVKEPRSDIPAITHVDYTARVQTIRREDHPDYYDLIKAFKELTGYSVIVNTSFNVRGEPIVCTPYDAYRCFMRTNMDVLVLNDFLLLKEEQPPWPEKKGRIVSYSAEQDAVENASERERYRRLFRDDFLTFQKTIKNYSHILEFRGRNSTWVDFDSELPITKVFSIPHVLDTLRYEPKKMAEAITRYWQDDDVKSGFLPILEKILSVQVAGDREHDQIDDVSDSVYVMY